uniref:Ly6/PLAUR domain-containing protein 1 isoform X1 n=1 Tax=Pogona vitticeps TaxID=103695 RepID=A0ABM5F509_9SAUR
MGLSFLPSASLPLPPPPSVPFLFLGSASSAVASVTQLRRGWREREQEGKRAGLRRRCGLEPRCLLPPALLSAAAAAAAAPVRRERGFALQIQCYQCEEFQLNNDCSSPEFIVNCTVNVQDMCQKEVMEQSTGILYRKSCASSAACLTTSAGYQTFCTPGKINSVCISCCNTPLCNGPRPKKRRNVGTMPRAGVLTTMLLPGLALLSPVRC